MKLLVFGYNGQVATELRAKHSDSLNIQALDRDAADLTNVDQCAEWIAKTDADAIINAAAYTAVDRAETEENLATLINGTAPTVMAEAASKRSLPFLHISTDYVFDGGGTEPHRPTDPVAPANAYGRSKLVGEEGVRAAGGRHVILRTSWVFSAHGQNFAKTMLRLAETRNELSIVSDQIGGPTPANAIAKTLISIAAALCDGAAGGTFHFCGAPAVSWADFARAIFSANGLSINVSDIPSSAYPTPARRPLNSRLDCSSLREAFDIEPASWADSIGALNGHS